MYLVKSSQAAAFPVVFDGPNVAWEANQVRLVDDNMHARYSAHSDTFTVVAGPDMGAVIQALLDEQATDAPGAKNGATVTADENQPVVHSTVLTCVATPISIADDAGVAQYGGVKIYDFPEGLIQILGCVIDGAVTLGTTGTITTTWAGGIALGTATATTGNTLTGTEANIMAENNVAAATAKVAVVDAVSAASAVLDGTATAIDAYLNILVDDDATHTAGTGSFTGTVTINWVKLGDK
jgi:hypothetical protein